MRLISPGGACPAPTQHKCCRKLVGSYFFSQSLLKPQEYPQSVRGLGACSFLSISTVRGESSAPKFHMTIRSAKMLIENPMSKC